jgi:hypothetical protein
MRITSQQNDNTLARNWRGPYSRVLRGPHLSDALGLLVQRLARNSGLNHHHHGQGGSFVARRCVLCFLLCTQVGPSVQPPGAGAPPFSTEFTASTKKEKRSKKERNAATTANTFTSLYPALNTYKGGASDSGHTRNPGETGEVISAPERRRKPPVIRTSGGPSVALSRALRPVVFSHPGFRFASPWATILSPFQG